MFYDDRTHYTKLDITDDIICGVLDLHISLTDQVIYSILYIYI